MILALLAVIGALALLAAIAFVVAFYLFSPVLVREARESDERNRDAAWP